MTQNLVTLHKIWSYDTNRRASILAERFKFVRTKQNLVVWHKTWSNYTKFGRTTQIEVLQFWPSNTNLFALNKIWSYDTKLGQTTQTSNIRHKSEGSNFGRATQIRWRDTKFVFRVNRPTWSCRSSQRVKFTREAKPFPAKTNSAPYFVTEFKLKTSTSYTKKKSVFLIVIKIIF
jgi:hypothetical protein